MPKKASKRPTRAAAQGRRHAKAKVSAKKVRVLRTPSPTDTTAARDRFVSDLLIRGEAAKLDKSGKLPLGATHVIKEQGPDGVAVVRRVRFKMY